MSEFFIESIGPEYPSVFQVTPEIVSPLRITVELRAHNEPSGADLNYDL